MTPGTHRSNIGWGRGGPQGAAAAVCWAGSPGDYLSFNEIIFNLVDLCFMFSFSKKDFQSSLRPP